MSKRKVGKYVVTLTNEETVFFPESHLTKLDLINYYEQIAPHMLPFVKDRPISMQRFPQGIDEEGFYHKDAPDYFPPWIAQFPIKKQDQEIVHYVLINNPATLVYLANYGCITPHIWLSKIDKIDYPDRMIFDLDPSGGSFKKVQQAALILHELFDQLELSAFPMTTGSQGIHLIIPIKREHHFDWVRNFARAIAEHAVHVHPDRFTLEMHKEKRGTKIFLDILRNAFGQTGVAPYAVRAKPHAPVATPLAWNEVDDKHLTATKYTITNIFKRLAKTDNPWASFNQSRSSLNKAHKKLEK